MKLPKSPLPPPDFGDLIGVVMLFGMLFAFLIFTPN